MRRKFGMSKLALSLKLILTAAALMSLPACGSTPARLPVLDRLIAPAQCREKCEIPRDMLETETFEQYLDFRDEHEALCWARHNTCVEFHKGNEVNAPSAKKPPTKQEIEAAEKELRAIERAALLARARKDLISFTQVTMEDPTDPDNPFASRYDPQFFHRALAAALQDVIDPMTETRRLLVTFPPRHGKSELCTRRLIPFFVGQDPYNSVIMGTYNQPFADSWGEKVKRVIDSKQYQAIFPGTSLDRKNVQHLTLSEGGEIAFVGRGGSATGKGAHGIIIDDPIKDRVEAKSQTIRDSAWDWMKDVIETRLMSDLGWIILIMTRWHEDDPAGRILDPENPHFHPAEAKLWKKFEIRALAEEDDVLKRPVGEPLWPGRYGKARLEHLQKTAPLTFASLYQQRPSPADGDHFTRDMIVTYEHDDLPDIGSMTIYAASDHAVGQNQRNDYTVIIIAGVDPQGRIWILDVWWQKRPTDVVVDQMTHIMKTQRPLIWWAGKDHITKSIGPFLRRRRLEEGALYTNLVELSEKADKVAKAQPIMGMMRMGMVLFPKWAPWLQKATDELLKFDNGTHDDFVDALANLGRGLDLQRGSKPPPKKDTPRVGSLAWMKAETARREQQNRIISLAGGM